ncbi:MAG: hypothetical protein ACI9MC_003416 [Kiritimatiellia bacterium]|jgi:hypothetical protein
MSNTDHRRVVDEILKEMDMVVYRLELPASNDPQATSAERDRLRHDIERLRDRLQVVADGWW